MIVHKVVIPVGIKYISSVQMLERIGRDVLNNHTPPW